MGMDDYLKNQAEGKQQINKASDLYWQYYEEREKLEEMAREAWMKEGNLSGDEITKQNKIVDELYIKNLKYINNRK